MKKGHVAGGIGYYMITPFIYLISLLPFPVLYLVSDLFYLMLYYGVRYRRHVVLENLRRSFPEKSEQEIGTISRRYYRYLCDLFLETFKTLTITRKTMIRRCSFTPECEALFNRLAEEGRSAILVMGHLGNWEWAGNSFSIMFRQRLYVIYHPISNPYFNRLMYRMRSRFGTGLIAMKDTFREMIAHKAEVSVTAFIADQTPAAQNAYWTTFLNQDTPVFKGTEVIARKLDYPVVYAHVARTGRGYYRIHAEMLEEAPARTPDGAISEMHTKRLERDIVSGPETWLWSHRRWKHKKP